MPKKAKATKKSKKTARKKPSTKSAEGKTAEPKTASKKKAVKKAKTVTKKVAGIKATVKKRPSKKSPRAAANGPTSFGAGLEPLVDSPSIVPTHSPTTNGAGTPAVGENGTGIEERIRMRAYFKWQEAGCPSGDGSEFWLAAESDYEETAGR